MTKEKINAKELRKSLKEFTGTENYYLNFTGIKYTDGIKYLAEKAGAYWLIDLVGSYQHQLKEVPFQLWVLKVNKNKTAVITCQEDSNLPVIIEQKIQHTDFPLKELMCYCIGGILLLPSEY